MTTPFGVPVEPEVNRMCAASPGPLRQSGGPVGARRTSSSENAGATCSCTARSPSSHPTAIDARSRSSVSSSSSSSAARRSEEHTSELQSLAYLVCRLLLEKKKKKINTLMYIEDKRVTQI